MNEKISISTTIDKELRKDFKQLCLDLDMNFPKTLRLLIEHYNNTQKNNKIS